MTVAGVLLVIFLAAYVSSRSVYWAVVLSRLMLIAAGVWVVGVGVVYYYSGRDGALATAILPPLLAIVAARLLSWAFRGGHWV